MDPSEKDNDWEDDNKEDGNKEGGNKDGKKKDDVDSEDEEDNTDSFMEAGRCEPKVTEDICEWLDLRDPIKNDILKAHKDQKPLIHINQLLVLRNFATLQIQGDGCIVASMKITKRWMDSVGTYFACQIQFLARHYQLFEEIPPEKWGKYLDRSLLSDEQVQTATRTYLTGLPTGEVTPADFRRRLNKHILPLLGYTFTNRLSERTAMRWLVNLGWRSKLLKKGVYMDGHERPDVVEYCKNVFLPMMASYQDKMVKWQSHGSNLKCANPRLGTDEKRIITLFQDESCFHANEYRASIWCVPLFLGPRNRSHDLGKDEGR